jgi:hypothetical protein
MWVTCVARRVVQQVVPGLWWLGILINILAIEGVKQIARKKLLLKSRHARDGRSGEMK